MTEYIERDYVLKLLGVFNDRVHSDYHFMNGIETAKEIVEDAPSADVQPVVHGRWIDGDCRCVTAVCSNCNRLRLGNGAKSAMRLALYCEKCGARMDGKT